MALPVSGAISFNNINVELGVAGTTQASLGQASYRTLAGVASGAISMSNFYGKANEFAFSIASNQTNANLRTLAVNAGWNQTSKVIATINSGIYCSANGTGTPALTVNGSFPNGIELVNNGFIIGMGGNGGAGAFWASTGSPGAGGGLALSVSVGASIRNNGTIGGGGGGGGGGGSAVYTDKGIDTTARGGGGGGGRSSAAANSSGGAGFNAGGAGTVSSAGSGGNGQTGLANGGRGGNGGDWGASGAAGASGVGANGSRAGGAGGGGGAAVSGNGNITWLATGTRLGAIS
jgi:hypothetical protein